jgi:glycine/D-amino acid oxidase-like deaminating enzyme
VTAIHPANLASTDARDWVLTTPRGELKCNYVVHATNAYASYLLPHMQGPEGIIPTRGQVMALRADTSLVDLSRSGWGGNEGFEYWFPRPVADPATDKPLVILGGGREAVSPKFELYVEDDSAVNQDIGQALRNFLPSVFPGKFQKGREPEMEWVSYFRTVKMIDLDNITPL